MSRTTGERFARALADKDRDRLHALLAGEIDFRALTPSRYWVAKTPGEVVDDVVLGCWFASEDYIRELVSVTTGQLADREHIAYRLRVRNPDGDFIVEQQAYYTVDGDQINWMRVLCSGYRPEHPAVAREVADQESRLTASG